MPPPPSPAAAPPSIPPVPPAPPPIARPITLPADPGALWAAWPPARPLAAVWAADPAAVASAAVAPPGPPDAPIPPPAIAPGRWTILGPPTRTELPLSLAAWESLLRSTQHPHPPDPAPPPAGHADHLPPFGGGWLGWISYELGHTLEPRLAASPTGDPALPGAGSSGRGWPLMCWQRLPAALCFDHAAHAWWIVGDPAAADALEADARAWLTAAAAPRRPFFFDRPASAGPGRYTDAVRRALAYIHAGDAYQVNLAHRLTGRFKGSTRAFFAALAHAALPRHGFYMESPLDSRGLRHILASASPELFLAVRDRRAVARPMKGTRPGDADPAELQASPKDQAELNMIVDLMRNDLGRVAALGSVRVDDPRAIERHGPAPASPPTPATNAGVWQAVATVSATLRDDVGPAALLAACFPPGSVTGAPKIRAMQIIEELETHGRGPYCGCAGFASDCGSLALNVAIRTACITGRPAPGPALDVLADGLLDHWVGAGIVADSNPHAEWDETVTKAASLLALARPRPAPPE